MADEEKNEQQAEAPPEQTPAEEAPAEETPAAEAPTEEPPADDAGPSEPEQAEASEPKAAPAAAKPKDDGEPQEAPTPKQIRKRSRSAHKGEPSPQRTAEERAAERQAGRKRKAAERSRYRAAAKKRKDQQLEGTPPAERQPGTQKMRLGIVTGSKADKTITVQVESARRHPAYEKIVRRSKSLHVHDENNEAGEGDTVRVIETRPMSKTKRWRLVEVVEKAE
jgi:small subunit ribosomal protein S17